MSGFDSSAARFLADMAWDRARSARLHERDRVLRIIAGLFQGVESGGCVNYARDLGWCDWCGGEGRLPDGGRCNLCNGETCDSDDGKERA